MRPDGDFLCAYFSAVMFSWEHGKEPREKQALSPSPPQTMSSLQRLARFPTFPSLLNPQGSASIARGGDGPLLKHLEKGIRLINGEH